MRPVLVIRDPVCCRQKRDPVRQSLFFGNEIDDILAEPVNAEIQPEAEDPLDLFPDLRVIHVEIRLLLRKKMQIILFAHRIIFPCLAFEKAVPVVRLVPPDVIVAVGIVLPFPAL